MKILISGIAGFIGNHVANHYVSLGHEVHGVDLVRAPNLNPLTHCYTLNVANETIPDQIIQDLDIIVHCAAQIDVRKSILDPRADLSMNVGATLKLLEQAKSANVKKFIFASSGGAIADSEQPSSPYGISKLTAEKYIRFYHQHHGLDYSILRYSNVYGQNQKGGVIPIFISKLLKNLPIEINGGSQKRDFIFVEDVAKVNELALTLPSDTYTVCSEYSVTISHLADLLKVLTNSSSKIIHKDQIKGEVMESTLKRSDILRDLPITSLEQGLVKTIKSFTT